MPEVDRIRNEPEADGGARRKQRRNRRRLRRGAGMNDQRRPQAQRQGRQSREACFIGIGQKTKSDEKRAGRRLGFEKSPGSQFRQRAEGEQRADPEFPRTTRGREEGLVGVLRDTMTAIDE